MKEFLFLTLLVLFSGFYLGDAFADHSEVTIVPASGSGAPGCEETADGCYIPTTATVDVGGTVIMSNTDTAAHTFTSIDSNQVVNGIFDTSLLMAGSSYEWSPDTVGEYQYYCMVHPWMQGLIIVQEVGAQEDVVQLTIDSLEIYQDGDYTRYHVIGDAPASTNLTFTMTKPDGSDGDYNGSAGTGQPSYNQDGLVSPTDDLVYGIWNLEICAAEHNMCVDESFTIEDPEPTYDEFIVIVEEGTEIPGIGDSIQIKLFHAAQTVSIYISSSNGELIDSLEFPASSQGEINQPWVIPSSLESGMYTVSARDAFNSDCIRFDVDTFETDENCTVYSPESETTLNPTIDVNTNDDDYEQNDTIQIFGQVTNPSDSLGDIVEITVKAPNGNIVSISQESIDTNGNFSTEITAGGALMQAEGDYNVIAKYGNIGGPSDSTSFYYGGNVNDSVPDEEDYESQITIVPADGSGAPGCEETADGCYHPEIAYVATGGLVIFSNTDTAAHTFTSGTPDSGANGIFDTGLLMAGQSFDYVAEEAGEIEYLCMVHPWMVGILVVGGDPVETPQPEPEPESLSIRINSSSYDDGDDVTITGQILNYDYTYPEVSYSVGSPDYNLVQIGEMDISSDGSFTENFDVGGPLYKTSGTYTIKFYYGGLTEKISFQYYGEYNEPDPTDAEIESLSTRKTQYRTGDTIVVYGKVKTTDFNIPVTLQTFNDGNIVDIAQISVSSDETFTHTILAEGPLWYDDGKYEIRAIFGNDVEDTSFIFRTDDRSYPQPEPEPDSDLDYEVTIVPADGSGAPGCEETSDGCYLPRIVSVSRGGVVIMSNTDTAAHTYTSGTPQDGPDGNFDTGLLMAGSSYEWIPSEEGIYPYFCMVHPWMIGTILVGEGTMPPPEPEPDDHIDLEIEIEGRVFDINTIVEMQIFLEGNSNSQDVAIDITDPRGTTIISRSIEVGPNGSESFEFKITENFKQGNYRVTATTSDGNRTEKDTAHFKVKSQFNSFKIDSVSVTDQKGNPSDLEVDETGFIKVNISSSKSIATLLTVNIFDAELTSIGIGSVQTTLSSGDSEIILSFNIPDDAAIGPAEIYVNAFSDWPSEGGVPLTGEVSIVEDIE